MIYRSEKYRGYIIAEAWKPFKYALYSKDGVTWLESSPKKSVLKKTVDRLIDK